eukprot:TRINITY_DN16347_c1_g1_i15.p1 TRINITY_DN16347_c1_g1~~TRINITY_DN16347_c1_g1_i15.p1  ORF type:complete len:522 (+),score=100.73 TRINITY_DN16347_c1_g1_i15:84-1568(+)
MRRPRWEPVSDDGARDGALRRPPADAAAAAAPATAPAGAAAAAAARGPTPAPLTEHTERVLEHFGLDYNGLEIWEVRKKAREFYKNRYLKTVQEQVERDYGVLGKNVRPRAQEELGKMFDDYRSPGVREAYERAIEHLRTCVRRPHRESDEDDSGGEGSYDSAEELATLRRAVAPPCPRDYEGPWRPPPGVQLPEGYVHMSSRDCHWEETSRLSSGPGESEWGDADEECSADGSAPATPSASPPRSRRAMRTPVSAESVAGGSARRRDAASPTATAAPEAAGAAPTSRHHPRFVHEPWPENYLREGRALAFCYQQLPGSSPPQQASWPPAAAAGSGAAAQLQAAATPALNPLLDALDGGLRTPAPQRASLGGGAAAQRARRVRRAAAYSDLPDAEELVFPPDTPVVERLGIGIAHNERRRAQLRRSRRSQSRLAAADVSSSDASEGPADPRRQSPQAAARHTHYDARPAAGAGSPPAAPAPPADLERGGGGGGA